MGRIAISFVGDLAVQTGESTVIVDSDSSYVDGCRSIDSAVRGDEPIDIWVRTRNHFVWLQNFTGQLGIDANFTEKTARTLLADLWNTAVPDWVLDIDILSQGLLDLDVEGKIGKSFERILLSSLLGSAFDIDSLDAQNTGHIIAALVNDKLASVTNQYPIAEVCIRRASSRWRELTNDQWIAELCDHIPGEVVTAWRWITASSLLHSYPAELLERILPIDQAAVVRKIPADTAGDLILEPNIREEALSQIALLFADVGSSVKTGTDFQKIVEWVSGRTTEEFHFVLELLQSRRFDPTEEDVALVQSVFQKCPGIRRTQLMSLHHVVRPQYPTLIGAEESWNTDRWVQWTVNEYAPYREWQIRNDDYDVALEETVCCFSDWYVDSYMAVHADSRTGLTQCLSALNTEVKTKTLVIVLIIDCLPLAYASIMEHELHSSGFRRHELSYRYSALPTVTEYNKGALLAGKHGAWPKGYADLLAERAKYDWGGAETHYVATIKELSELQPSSGPSIVVVNFTEGDEILHSNVEFNNRTYDEELSRSYSQLVGAVAELCDRWPGSRESISALVVTDHGACRVLDDEKKAFESSAVNKLFDDEKHRMATMTSAQAEKIPANLWELGYRFQTPFSSDDLVHFLPRGHNTVRKVGTNKGYLHGGVSPEEVIVPFVRYGLVAISWKKPFCRFLNLEMNPAGDKARFYIQRIVKVEIEIQNPNSVPIQMIGIEVPTPDTAVKGLAMDDVEPESLSTMSVDLYFQKAALSSSTLELKLRYEISGEEYEHIFAAPSEFRSALSGGFNLRDLSDGG